MKCPENCFGESFQQIKEGPFSGTSGIPCRKKSEPDIKNIHQWSNELGGNTIKNSEASSNNLTLVLKADLVRRYPGTHLFAIKTTSNTSPQQWENILRKWIKGNRELISKLSSPYFPAA